MLTRITASRAIAHANDTWRLRLQRPALDFLTRTMMFDLGGVAETPLSQQTLISHDGRAQRLMLVGRCFSFVKE